MNTPIRAAAVQFAAGMDIAVNLATCLRMLDEAARVAPHLVVMPEFCNHASWYHDADHCYQVAVALDGDFVARVGAKAAQHHFYVMLNCTVRRPANRVTGTNILFDPTGAVVAVSNKQVLMGNENNFLTKANALCPILDTPVGRLGMYSCMDGVIFETPRGLALRGAHILCNSLNSFAHDEASLHVPVRAAENRVFVVAANKVGPLVPEHLLADIAARVKIAPEHLHGAGESQIVAPDGTVLAKAPRTGEAVIYADLDPARANDKRRADGTDVFAARRPALYAPLAQAPAVRQHTPGAPSVAVGVYQPAYQGDDVVEEVAAALVDHADLRLVVLPELFLYPSGQPDEPPARAAARSARALDVLSRALAPQQVVAASIVRATPDGFAHAGVLLGQGGVLLEQRQLHRAARHAWVTTPGDALHTYDLPFGRVALVVGDDALYPEVFRLAALSNVEVALVPMRVLESWEMQIGLPERAAENRIGLIAASVPTPAGASAIITVDEDFTLWTEWKHRPFDGNINYPLVTRAPFAPGMTRAHVHPARAANRLVSQKTDVVDGRPYWLLQALVNT